MHRGLAPARQRKETSMSNLHLVQHPLVQHKLTLLRDKNTGAKEFRELLLEITLMMGYELTRDLPVRDITVETPVCPCPGKMVDEKLAVIPLLRGGLSMTEGILRLLPNAPVGHVGVYRDPKTLRAVEYYCKLPSDMDTREALILDPMLATGNTASAAISFIKQRGCKRIKMLSIIANTEGIARLQADHPDVEVYAAAVDEELNETGYAVPGLGDLGTRLFGTK